jgi:hypothetical protein
MRDDQGDDIADALDQFHAGGWNVGDTAFYVEGGGLVHVVIGTNGENRIRAEGAACREAWRRARRPRSWVPRRGAPRWPLDPGPHRGQDRW